MLRGFRRMQQKEMLGGFRKMQQRVMLGVFRRMQGRSNVENFDNFVDYYGDIHTYVWIVL